jgi:hypothetical protein
MINGDVNDFLERMDVNEWDIFYSGYHYFFQTIYDGKNGKTRMEIQFWKANPDASGTIVDEKDSEDQYVDYHDVVLPEFPSYEECIRDFLLRKLFDNGTKTFWEVQDRMIWFD